MSVSAVKALFAGGGFDINALMSTGLTLFVSGGTYVHASLGLQRAPNVTLALAASSTTYVEVDANGVISGNTTGFTSTSTSLYKITTGSAEVTGIADCREMGGLNGLIDGAQVTNMVTANVVGVVPVMHVFTLAAGANADNDIVLTHKERVVDVFVVLQGAGVGSSVLTVKNGATAITNAIATSGTDQALIRAATMDDAAWTIAAGGTLRATSSAGASQPAMTVYVTCVRVP